MKSKYLPLIAAVIILCFNACKKESNTAVSQLVGKWYENKLVIHSSNGTAVDHDTTYTSASFIRQDYFEFTSDKKATFSQSGMFDVTGKSIVTSGGQIDIAFAHYTWSVSGSTLTLNNTDRVPGTEYAAGSTYQEKTIVQLDATNLILRTIYFSGQPLTVTTTAYFTKGK